MTSVAAPATELLPIPRTGRVFTAERTVRLGDVDGRGELRLDAIARYLQDVASDDALDAGLPNAMGWLVRRTMIRVDAPATLNQSVTATTFCTGSGRSWAERRTSLSGADGGRIEAVSLWVQVDVESGRPSRLGDEFHARYGEAAAGRVVSSKLRLPRPPTGAATRPWAFRETDLDPFAHVNNAAQWAFVESALVEPGISGPEPGDAGPDRSRRTGTFELEYLVPVDLTTVHLVTAGTNAWLADGDRVLSASAWSAGSAGSAGFG